MIVQLIMRNFWNYFRFRTLIFKDFPLIPQLKKSKKNCPQESRINRLFIEFLNLYKKLFLLTENTTASILKAVVTPYIDKGAKKKREKHENHQKKWCGSYLRPQ